MTTDSQIKNFCNDYCIKIVDTNQFIRKYQMIPSFNYFVNQNNYNEITYSNLSFETEPLYTVQIPKSELDRIVDFRDLVNENMRLYGNINLFEALMKQKELENNLRKTYPAVQKAFEQYSLVLNIAKSGGL